MARKPSETEDTKKETHASARPLVPSELDERTHAEMRMLYAESSEALRFIKNHQWKTVGATLLTFFGMIIIAILIRANPATADRLMLITIVLATAVIFTVVIYQFWMANELIKLNRIELAMSSLLREVRALKSRREGNVHRYTLLLFMASVVIMGAMVVHLALSRIASL